MTEIDDFKAEKEALKTEAQDKEDALVSAGRVVRDVAMSRSSSRANEDRNSQEGDEEDVIPMRKRRKLSPQNSHHEIAGSIKAVEEEEEHRCQMAERQDARDEERLLLEKSRVDREEKQLMREEKRLETDSRVAQDRNEIERRRVALEERRFDADRRRAECEAKRAEELSAERKVAMEVQKGMLELVRELQRQR